VTGPLLALAAFAGMEGVSYAAHRWVMHGFAMGWHRSHHRPRIGRFEKNDLFPLCFSSVGVALCALATMGPAIAPLLWVAGGITAYGAIYLVVHEVYIHDRVPLPLPRLGYLDHLRDAHRIHHLFGGEPYGMLVPVVSRGLRGRAADRLAADRSATDRSTAGPGGTEVGGPGGTAVGGPGALVESPDAGDGPGVVVAVPPAPPDPLDRSRIRPARMRL
jgi:beta-carotene 3-hydroxylase